MPVDKKSDLRKRASIAKRRMKEGYWQNVSDEKERRLNESEVGYGFEYLFKDFQLVRLERDERLMFGDGDVLEEEAFYQKVCEILEGNELVIDPIGKLIDRKEYERLDELNRQKYILEISKKFREMKERYDKEKSFDNILR